MFKRTIWNYYWLHGRDFPWRRTHNPYKILVSEVMLQQTQTSRVISKYKEFIRQFPNFQSLQRVQLSRLLQSWSGLGYNRRALNLKKLAQIVVEKYGGTLPRDSALLEELPGIGSGTAGAICAFAFNLPVAFIETNIRRAFIYHFFSKKHSKKHSNILQNVGMFLRGRKVNDGEILKLVAVTVDKKNPREWYYALMDYGNMLAKQSLNPNRRSRHYTVQPKFKGSNRELRGKIVRFVAGKRSVAISKLEKEIAQPIARVWNVLKELEREQFLKISKTRVRIN